VPGKQNDPKPDSVGSENARGSSDQLLESQTPTNGSVTPNKDSGSGERKPTRGPESFEKWEREEMEELLGELCGHLGIWMCTNKAFMDADCSLAVIYPTRFLEGEDVANNFLFNADRLVVI